MGKKVIRPITYIRCNKEQWLNDIPKEIAKLICNYGFYFSGIWTKVKNEDITHYINYRKNHAINAYIHVNYIALIIYCKNKIQVFTCKDYDYSENVYNKLSRRSYMKKKYVKAVLHFHSTKPEQVEKLLE